MNLKEWYLRANTDNGLGSDSFQRILHRECEEAQYLPCPKLFSALIPQVEPFRFEWYIGKQQQQCILALCANINSTQKSTKASLFHKLYCIYYKISTTFIMYNNFRIVYISVHCTMYTGTVIVHLQCTTTNSNCNMCNVHTVYTKIHRSEFSWEELKSDQHQ